MNNYLTKEQLIARLKELSQNKTPYRKEIGAMCYQRGELESKLKCWMCGDEISMYDIISETALQSYLTSFRDKGYDVKAIPMCTKCLEELGIEYPDKYWKPEMSKKDKKRHAQFLQLLKDKGIKDMFYVFFFKAKDEEDYHVAVTNNSDDFETVESLLSNSPIVKLGWDEEDHIKHKHDVIRRMLGISYH